jgi:prolipoprotein diacylglyceryltransferase
MSMRRMNTHRFSVDQARKAYKLANGDRQYNGHIVSLLIVHAGGFIVFWAARSTASAAT